MPAVLPASSGVISATQTNAQQKVAFGSMLDYLAERLGSFTTTGTSTAYIGTPVPAVTAYFAGQSFRVTFHTASGASPTLQISGVANPPNLVRRLADNILINIAAGEIPAGSFWVVGLSATQFEVTGLPAVIVGPGNSALSGNRNRIINGPCDIAQRAALACSVGVSGYGAQDRYFAQNSVAGGQFNQGAGGFSWNGISRSAVRQSVITGTTAFTTTNFWHGITQFIEGFNSYDLRGKPVALSFIFNTNLTGTYSVALRDSTSSQSYVTTFAAVANTPLQVKILIPAIPLGASIPISNAIGLYVVVGFQNQATFQTSTLNAWQAGNFSSANTATIWAATAANFIELTDLQLEEGTAVTPTERRSYPVEFALCQRYYEEMGQIAFTVTTSAAITWKVRKRVAPSLTLVISAGTGATFNTNTDATGAATSGVYQDGGNSLIAQVNIKGNAEL